MATVVGNLLREPIELLLGVLTEGQDGGPGRQTDGAEVPERPPDRDAVRTRFAGRQPPGQDEPGNGLGLVIHAVVNCGVVYVTIRQKPPNRTGLAHPRPAASPEVERAQGACPT